MTATDAIWTQGGDFTATEDRALISALTGARHFTDLAPGVSKVDAGGGHGAVGATDLAVTPGAGHSVDVAAGQAFVRGTQSAGQGTYVVGNDATVNLAISTPDATNDRIDLVQIRVSDDSAGAGATVIDVKAGTPAGSPSAPTPDENALVVAQVLVPASAASSANYTITDRRTRAFALGGQAVASSTATLPNPASAGQSAYLADSKTVATYDGAQWVRPAGFAFRRTTDQSIANNTVTAIAFTSGGREFERPEAGSIWSGSATSRFTVPAGHGGPWMFTGTCQWESNTSGVRSLQITKNGTSVVGYTQIPGFSGIPVQQVSAIANLAAGDYIEFYVRQTSGGSLLAVASADYSIRFSGYRLP